MSLIPQPRYDGLRTFADLIIDVVFGQPLRHFQEFFRNRHMRRMLRRIRSVYRNGRIETRQALVAAFGEESANALINADAQREAQMRQEWGINLGTDAQREAQMRREWGINW